MEYSAYLLISLIIFSPLLRYFLTLPPTPLYIVDESTTSQETIAEESYYTSNGEGRLRIPGLSPDPAYSDNSVSGDTTPWTDQKVAVYVIVLGDNEALRTDPQNNEYYDEEDYLI